MSSNDGHDHCSPQLADTFTTNRHFQNAAREPYGDDEEEMDNAQEINNTSHEILGVLDHEYAVLGKEEHWL